ncbi:MAG: hypothetical protein EXR83_04575 [Gammaproteobacteria bacterium]|nr:hypothetical protein [Gammaproteobacteria bacterium]
MTVAMADWGKRLSDTLRAALAAGDLATAARLVEDGDGMARSLAKEYTLMYRGLGITLRVMQPLLLALALRTAKEEALCAHLRDFAQDIDALAQAAWGTTPGPVQAGPGVVPASAAFEASLSAAEAGFEPAHRANAAAVLAAILAGDAAGAQALVEHKVAVLYLPLHDRLVRWMADSMAFALRHGGEEGLLRFQMDSAQGQRAGFDKWEDLSAAEFAQASAFLLKMHMGNLTVSEDAQRYTLSQSLCGSGGRLRVMGAYAGPQALPFVETAGPLTFGLPRLPVYCSHCPIWNGTATLAWYGRVHWLFEQPARADGSCTAHIYKRAADSPAALVDVLRLSAPTHAA